MLLAKLLSSPAYLRMTRIGEPTFPNRVAVPRCLADGKMARNADPHCPWRPPRAFQFGNANGLSPPRKNRRWAYFHETNGFAALCGLCCRPNGRRRAAG